MNHFRDLPHDITSAIRQNYEATDLEAETR